MDARFGRYLENCDGAIVHSPLDGHPVVLPRPKYHVARSRDCAGIRQSKTHTRQAAAQRGWSTQRGSEKGRLTRRHRHSKTHTRQAAAQRAWGTQRGSEKGRLTRRLGAVTLMSTVSVFARVPSGKSTSTTTSSMVWCHVPYHAAQQRAPGEGQTALEIRSCRRAGGGLWAAVAWRGGGGGGNTDPLTHGVELGTTPDFSSKFAMPVPRRPGRALAIVGEETTRCSVLPGQSTGPTRTTTLRGALFPN